MTIVNRFATSCAACGAHIPVGTMIDWRRGHRARHVVCPSAQTPAQPQQAQHAPAPVQPPTVARTLAELVTTVVPVAGAETMERPIELDTLPAEAVILRRRSRDALTCARVALTFPDLDTVRNAINVAIQASEAIRPNDPILVEEIGEVAQAFSDAVNAHSRATEARIAELTSEIRNMAAAMHPGAIGADSVEIVAAEIAPSLVPYAPAVIDSIASEIAYGVPTNTAPEDAGIVALMEQTANLPSAIEAISDGALGGTAPTAPRAYTERGRAYLANRGRETPEQRARTEKAAAELRARVRLDSAITVALANPSGEYPHGCLAAWHATGPVRYDRVAAAAAVAGVAPPKPRTLKAIASAAVKAIKDHGLKVAVVTRGSEWSVYRPAAQAEVGSSVGAARLVAKLVGEELQLEGPADLCHTVRSAFDRARSESTLGSTEVSAWLSQLLASYRAVAVVYGRWMAPGLPTEVWCALASALNDAGLPVPSRPAAVSSREDVKEEIRTGLIREIDTELARITEDRKRSSYASGAALSAIEDLEALADKAIMFATITGPGALDTQIATIKALQSDLTSTIDRAPLDMGRS